MPLLTSIVTVTKPPGATWFDESTPEAADMAKTTREWIDSRPGFISSSKVQVDENTRVVTTLWESWADYKAYQADRFEHDNHVTKKAYNDRNGIVTTSVETYQE